MALKLEPPHITYKFYDGNKLEFGIDYRVNSLENYDSRDRSWVSFKRFVVIADTFKERLK